MRFLAALSTMVMLAVLFSGCSQDASTSLDEAEDAMGEAADNASDAVGDVTSEASDAFQDVAGGLSDAAGETVGNATQAVTDLVGGADVSKSFTALFGSATEALNGITDEGTAKAALPKLSELGTKLDGLTGMLNKLPSGAKSGVMEVIKKGLGELRPLAEKVLAIPGVEAIIKPTLDGLESKLTALGGGN